MLERAAALASQYWPLLIAIAIGAAPAIALRSQRGAEPTYTPYWIMISFVLFAGLCYVASALFVEVMAGGDYSQAPGWQGSIEKLLMAPVVYLPAIYASALISSALIGVRARGVFVAVWSLAAIPFGLWWFSAVAVYVCATTGNCL